jgi:tetratricopeptide (TPR) repeat protein
MQPAAQRSDAKLDPVQAKALIQQLDTQLAADPTSADALWQRARVYADVGNADAAIRDLNMLVAATPNHYHAVIKRGDCRMTLSDVVGAFKDYAEAIRIAPDRPEAYFARGLSLAEQYEYKDALTNFDRAIQLSPNDAKLYRARARAQRARASKAVADGESENASVNANSAFGSSFDPKIMALAILDFSRAIELEDNLRTRLDRASTLDSAERWEEALVDYRYVIERTKADAQSNPRGEAAALFRMASEGEKEMQSYLGEDLPQIKPKAPAAKPGDLDAFKAALNQTLASPPAKPTPSKPKPAEAAVKPAPKSQAKPTESKPTSAKAAGAQPIEPKVADSKPARPPVGEKPEKPVGAAMVDTSAVPIDEVRMAPPAPDKAYKPSGADRLNAKRYARRVLAHVRENTPDFIKVKVPYRHLDRKFYAAAKSELEASQFKHIVNVEPLHITRPQGIKTFWSVLVSPSGRTVAIICESYDEPASAFARIKANTFGALPNRVAYVELVSEFSDNSYVITNNLGKHQIFDASPNSDYMSMDATVDINRLVGMHRSRMDDYLSEHPGIQSTVVRSWKDFTALLNRQRLQKLAHRTTLEGGIKESELQRLTGSDYVKVAGLVRDELATLLAKR